ncbi:MAG: hypothetical protein WCY76_11400 [Leucobacter sp.]
MEEKFAQVISRDSPSVVVELKMMESAEQNSAVNVGAAGVGYPFVDVVSFAVGGGAIAARPPAASVSNRECDALFCCVEALFSPDI